MSDVLVRIRPASDTLVGRSLAESSSLMEAAFGDEPGLSLDIEFMLDVTDDEHIDDIAQLLHSETEPHGVIFIDASFPTDALRSYQVLDSLVWLLLVTEPISSGSADIVILMEELPVPVDQIADLMNLPELKTRLIVVDEAGRTLGGGDATHVVDALKSHPPVAPDIDREILRRRGVFRNQGKDSSFYSFYYEPTDAGSDLLERRLLNALQAYGPRVVVYDATISGDWFPSLVRAVSVKLSSRSPVAIIDTDEWLSFQAGTLKKPQNRHAAHVAEALKDETSTVAFIIPAFSSGRAAMRTVEAVGRPLLSRSQIFAIIVGDRRELRAGSYDGTLGASSLEYAGSQLDVEVFYQAALDLLGPEDWLVRAASALGEVNDLPAGPLRDERLQTSTVWSLLRECGVGKESFVPPSRAPRRYYPVLERMSPWDAHYIGELVVQKILRLVPNSTRDAMLVVVPDEETGIGPISRALLHRCNTAVLRVPRMAISGGDGLDAEVTRKLRRHQAETLVVFDEATVTYSTLLSLGTLVKRELGRSVDLTGCVFNLALSDPPAGTPFFHLRRWRAVQEEV